MVGVGYAKNVKSSCRKLFKKLRKAHSAAAASGSGAAGMSGTPEADDSEASEQQVEEESSKQPVPTKKATAATAKKGATKKTVGKTVTPKKASAGGPKTPAKGKGAKGKKVETNNEDEGELVAKEDDVVSAKSDPEDEQMNEDGEDGKLPQSLTSNTALPLPVMTEAPLSVVINGEAVVYTPRDIEVANSHEVTLVDYLIWKSENNYNFYLNVDQKASASQSGVEVSDKV